MSDRKIDRKAVRALAERNHRQIGDAVREGRNVDQLILDQGDELNDTHAMGMSIDEKTQFFTMYAEELNALNSQLDIETNKNLEKIEQRNKVADAIGSFIGAVILVFVVFWLLKTFLG